MKRKRNQQHQYELQKKQKTEMEIISSLCKTIEQLRQRIMKLELEIKIMNTEKNKNSEKRHDYSCYYIS